MSQHPIEKAPLLRSPLSEFHSSLGAKMTAFGGFLMPLNYPTGILAEHKHCRAQASLFDVSHMGQFTLTSPFGLEHLATELETLVPGNIIGLKPGKLCYTMFTNNHGGIIDDLIVAHTTENFLVIGNANNRTRDLKILREGLSDTISITQERRGLIALQGPASSESLIRHSSEPLDLLFLEGINSTICGCPCWVSRSGYTGEDGYEIAAAPDAIQHIAKTLLLDKEVGMAGLGARDTLRLEAGLSLCGQDLTEEITPVEADLSWTINSRRRDQASFPGAAVILKQLHERPSRRKIGLTIANKAIARTGTPIKNKIGQKCGEVTSGGFSPTTNNSIAVGYVDRTRLPPNENPKVTVRDKDIEAREVPLPFVPHRYFRK
ncbi:MAG: glycine cleavage system aminomethyltransferase GcvT [Pseudomonadota bacterium]|nr:glycine cleavage system aminomethyltransferase GcvT [Pseudomonadota bacterium]